MKPINTPGLPTGRQFPFKNPAITASQQKSNPSTDIGSDLFTTKDGQCEVDGKHYKFVETVSDGNCGVDACQKLLQQAGIELFTDKGKLIHLSLPVLRKEIVKIVYNNLRSIKSMSQVQAKDKCDYLDSIFNNDVNTFINLAIKDIRNKIESQQKSPCTNEADEAERLKDIKAKESFINLLKKATSWEDLKELPAVDEALFIEILNS